MKLYGIAHCDTVKKARAWFANNHVAVEFQDFKKIPPDRILLERWSQQVGWKKLINRQGLTWRKLDLTQQAGVANANAAIALMLEKPSVIKRPLLEQNGRLLHLGFDDKTYAALCGIRK